MRNSDIAMKKAPATGLEKLCVTTTVRPRLATAETSAPARLSAPPLAILASPVPLAGPAAGPAPAPGPAPPADPVLAAAASALSFAGPGRLAGGLSKSIAGIGRVSAR